MSPIPGPQTEPKEVGKWSLNASKQVRCAKQTVISPSSEALVPVTRSHSSLRIIEIREELFQKKRLVLANGIARVKPSVLFCVKIAKSRNIPKQSPRMNALELLCHHQRPKTPISPPQSLSKAKKTTQLNEKGNRTLTNTLTEDQH